MSFSTIQILNFRNIANAQLDFDNRYNIFYGSNGSGKSSLLEAIYYLALGRSFRSHILRRIIRNGEKEFSLYGKIQKENRLIPVGIERSIVSGKRVKIAGENVNSNIELIKLLPVQLLNQDSYRLFDDGPKARRQFIDWGLFHVEQDFLPLWRRVERILEQRNTALRMNSSAEYIKTWDRELIPLCLELHSNRSSYVEKFIPVATVVLQQLLPSFEIEFTYFAGWDTEADLEKILSYNLKNDLRLGHTSVGPHRADLKLTIVDVPAKDVLSRGQQKLLLYGLQLAQGMLLYNLAHKKCIYLLDDLPAELDMQKRELLVAALHDLQAQIFVTGLAKSELENVFGNYNGKMFHVERGIISPDS